MADIFISYATEDRNIVRPFAKAIEDQGWSVWWDRHLPFGVPFDDVIRTELHAARCVVALWTENATKSLYVIGEARDALRQKKLISVFLSVSLAELPYDLQAIHGVELIDWHGDTSNRDYKSLVRGITATVDRPPQKKTKVETEHEVEHDLKRGEVPKTDTNSIGMEFVLIPSWTFTMGSSTHGKYEKPPHEVNISQSFYLQTTQVTQGQWEKVMGDNPSEFKDCGDDCPVETVSWDDAQRFIQKLNEKEGTDKHRLPTEAEWEYACRAGTTTDFCFGDDADKLGEYAWYKDNSKDKTHPVGRKEPNLWGLYDMHGNVWEWVRDDWHKNYKGVPKDGRAWIDEPRGAYRVYRGGGWGLPAQRCRSAIRDGWEPDYRVSFIGFRLARSVTLGP